MSVSKQQYGGIINKSDVLKHIISIGYEFETHDLAKLSLHEEKYLINSANNNEDMEEELRFDKNYFTYEAAMDLENDTDSSFFESDESKQSIKTAPTVPSGEIDAEFVEYMLEPRPKDGKKTKMAITNDIANAPFIKMLTKKCRGREKEKNSLYMYRTHQGKLYSIKFDPDMRKISCGNFSGLEIVITYYKPKRGDNVILETFADACERIVQHLSGLKESRGDLFLANKNKKGFSAIGKIPYRRLFHKDGTNLFYMETYDNEMVNSKFPLSEVVFKPQMTYCANIEHVYDIIEYLSYVPSDMRARRNEKNKMKIVYDNYVDLMNKCIIPMIEEYNELNTKFNWKCEIDMNTSFGKIIRNYLFLMYIKIDAYILFYEKQTEEELQEINAQKNYFKNYLYMLVRHSNFELYSRMKYYMKKQFKKTENETVELLNFLICNVDFLSETMYNNNPEIFGKKLAKSDPNYGDPKVSIESYFAYFENPIDKDFDDWFLYSHTDGESTMYPLKGDDIIIETRFFSATVRHFYGNTMGKRMSSLGDSLSLKQMVDFVAFQQNKSRQNLIMSIENKVLNPNTGRMVMKCEEGKVRNENFRCIKPKTTRPTKPKPTRTRRAAAK